MVEGSISKVICSLLIISFQSTVIIFLTVSTFDTARKPTHGFFNIVSSAAESGGISARTRLLSCAVIGTATT